MEKEKKIRERRSLERGIRFLTRRQMLTTLVPITSLVKNGREFFINATRGDKTICGEKNLFIAGIDEDFESLNKSEKPTQKSLVQIYKINKEESLLKTFSSINLDFDKLVLEQGQIIDFCANTENEALFSKNGIGTLFITKANNWFYAVLVITRKNGLEVILYDASSNKKIICEWISCKNLRIIVPDLTLSQQSGIVLL